MREGGIGGDALRPLEEVVATSMFDPNCVFGEPLPDVCGRTSHRTDL